MILFAAPLYADKAYYDQQEEIRKAAERLVEHDRQQRQEAKERYDQRYSYRRTQSGWEITWIVIKLIFWIGVIGFVAYCFM